MIITFRYGLPMRHLLPIATLVVAAAAASAQEPRDTSRLTPVVITASRTDGPQSVATTAATVLSGDALRTRGITTVGQALREVPGAALVQTSAPGSQASLFFRGGEPDYVQVLIDGVVLNEPGGTVNFANLTLDNVERIEVIRGPASVLYGSDAVTGVIQIFTRQGSDGPRGDIGVRAGQRGLLDIDGSIAGGSARARYSIGAGHHASAGIYDLNNDARNDNANARLTLVPTSRSSVSITGRYGDARYDYPTEYYGAALDPDSYTTERRLAAGVDAMYAPHPAADVRMMLGMSRLQNISDDQPDGPDDFGFRYESKSLRRSADARLNLRIIPASTLTLGGDFDWQDTETNGDTPAALPLLERWSRAGFAQLIGDAGARLSYTLGGRIEKNELFGTLGSVRAGAGFALAGSTTIRASGGTAFKEPQFPEITGGCCAVPNRGLQPEHSTSWELGLEQRFAGDAIALSVTAFDQRFRDLIIYAENPDAPATYRYENARTAGARGWELEMRAGVASGPSVRASVTGVEATMRRAEAAAEKPLPRRPSRTAALVIAAPIGDRLTLVGDATHVGPRHDTRFFADKPSEEQRLSSYTLLGVAGSLRLAGIGGASGVELTARVENLLDAEYEAVAGFATPGRIASIGARVRFGR
jgi:vitamin B12 transporter